MTNIMSLPTIPGGNSKEVDAFYKKLLYNVQSLETLGKLREVSGNVKVVLDKLKGIKADLVRGQDGWQEWDFSQLLQAIRHWKEINPVTGESENTSTPNRKNEKHDWNSRQRSYQTQQGNGRQPCGRVYCDKTDHFSVKSPKVVAVGDRRKILSQKQLNRFKCRALLDTGAGSSYVSSAITDHLGLRPIREEYKRIEMMLGSVNKVIGVYSLTINSLNGTFSLETEVTKVDRGSLLSLDNPRSRNTLTLQEYT